MTNAQENRGRGAVLVTAILMMLAAAIAANAQSFETLVNFGGTNGSLPYGVLAQGPDGNLYGTTFQGGAGSSGTVFRLSPIGVLTTIFSFCAQTSCDDGSQPLGGLALGSDGNLYGTTYYGGTGLGGTVFKITLRGKLTTLYNFDLYTEGGFPADTLVQGVDGNFYGTTAYGAGGACGTGCGTVFKITPEGKLTTLHAFTGVDGGNSFGGLAQGTDGLFYGTTELGGTYGYGTIFKITSGGTLTTLHNFCAESGCPDGQYPFAALVLASDGNFYGTTQSGGNGLGTVFRITPEGTLTTVYSFCPQLPCLDGGLPESMLIQGTDGRLYSTTTVSGAYGYGTVFRVSLGGTLNTLHSFDSTDGASALGGLAQDTNGNFYGTTSQGGSGTSCGQGCGTVFALSTGLHAFVETVPKAGKVAEPVTVIGTKLTGATNVTFNGIPAIFTVESATYIKATVPSGATTGPVQVVTPSGTLTSNVNFRVEH